jgi:hypothetical protein
MNPSRRILLASLLTLLVVAVTSQARADDLTPAAYRQLQAEAKEFVTVTIQSVQTKSLIDSALERIPSGVTVKATAVVKKVGRTSTGLKPGDQIQITYNTKPASGGFYGPAPIPLIEKGATKPAWLVLARGSSPDQRIYEPAAQAYSFAQVPNQIPAGQVGR